MISKIRITCSLVRPSIEWENQQREAIATSKKVAVKSVKNNFKKPETLELALSGVEDAVRRFISSYGVNFADIEVYYNELIMPDDPKKKESLIRRELAGEYKQKIVNECKLKAIYLAYQHLYLLVTNPQNTWNNFMGLNCLLNNLKAEEYFNNIIGILLYVKDLFSNNKATKSVDTQLEKLFELWAARNTAAEIYKRNCQEVEKATDVSDVHFILFSIIDYLSRRYKYNPTFRDELVNRCLEDIAIYEKFLMAFHSCYFVERDSGNGNVKEKYTFENVRKLSEYIVPRLNSFDVLYEIFKKENNIEKIKWLEDVGSHIRYRY